MSQVDREEHTLQSQLKHATGYLTETGQATQEDAGAKLTDAANASKHRLQQMGRDGQAKIDATTGSTADNLRSAASDVHEKTDRVAGLAHGAADGLQATSEYKVHPMMAKVGRYVRNHPGRFLLGAAAAILLIFRTMRHR